MTDEQIIKKLAYQQAHGVPGAAQARAFVTGSWLPFPDWELIYAALLKLARGRFYPVVIKHPKEQDCQFLLEALRDSEEGEEEA